MRFHFISIFPTYIRTNLVLIQWQRNECTAAMYLHVFSCLKAASPLGYLESRRLAWIVCLGVRQG